MFFLRCSLGNCLISIEKSVQVQVRLMPPDIVHILNLFVLKKKDNNLTELFSYDRKI